MNLRLAAASMASQLAEAILEMVTNLTTRGPAAELAAGRLGCCHRCRSAGPAVAIPVVAVFVKSVAFIVVDVVVVAAAAVAAAADAVAFGVAAVIIVSVAAVVVSVLSAAW